MSQANGTHTAKVVGLAMAGAVGGFLFGFDSSVINGAVEAVQGQFDLSNGVTGFAVASALLGSALGAYLGGRLSDRFGRTNIIVLGGVLFLISAIGSGLAVGVVDLIVWRVLGGVAVGIASVIAPAYIAEISPKHQRGTLSSLQQLAITLGIFGALLSDALFQGAAGGASEELWFGLEAWRWMFLAEAVPAIVYAVLGLLLPESPRYLVQKNREEEARDVLQGIWADEEVERGIREMEESIENDKRAAREGTLRGPRFGLQPIVWIGIMLSIFQQFVGINVIFYYSTTLWQAVGFDESNSFLISVITATTNVLVTFIAIFLVDKIGRRPILLTGSVGMTLSLATMAIAFSQSYEVDGAPQLPGAWGLIALVAANVFVVSYGASWGPLVWVLLGEIFPNRIRGAALGLAASAQWIANFLVTVSFPSMSSWSLPLTYGLYALFALLSFLFVLTKVPETKGRSLEEADSLLDEPVRPRRSR